MRKLTKCEITFSKTIGKTSLKFHKLKKMKNCVEAMKLKEAQKKKI